MSDITGGTPLELHTTFSFFFFYICSDAPEDIKTDSRIVGVTF